MPAAVRADLQLAALVLALAPLQAAANIVSVLGGPLSTCSKPGMAMTGFTRDGHCQDVGDDDAGSHHICIAMKPDFCSVTGQPNWCVKKMECMGQEGDCPIGNWCVCQWAFASYIEMAGGCDAIDDLVCDATNMAAVRAYEQHPRYAKALACVRQKCGLARPSRLSDATVPHLPAPAAEAQPFGGPIAGRQQVGSAASTALVAGALAGVAAVAVALRRFMAPAAGSAWTPEPTDVE